MGAPRRGDGNARERGGSGVMTRRALFAVIATGLALGVALGLSTDRLASFLPSQTLAVFDRPVTEADRWTTPDYPASDILDSRLIATTGDATVFVIRSEVDLSSGIRLDEPFICIAAQSPAVLYRPAGCTPESVVRTQGLRTVLEGMSNEPENFLAAFGQTRGIITVEWPPRGDPLVADMTDEVVVAPDDLYTDAEREQGRDIFLLSGLRGSPADVEVEAFLADFATAAELGPAWVNESTGPGNATISYLSVHAAAEAGQQRQVCLTGRLNGDLFPPACTSVAEFRDNGLQLELPSREGGVILLTADPGAGVAVDTTRSRPE